MINHNDYDVKANSSGYYLGSYKLIRLLGHGGFASVYLGEHQYLKRPAAIKVLRAVLAEQEKTNFLEEAKLLANLSHPHIVRVLEFAITSKQTFIQKNVVVENIPFLVMDYVDGGNLRTIYPSGTRLFLDTIINYINQVAEALDYAHTQHVIHRDIKPENLLLNERQEIMLSDFGLALFAPQISLMSRQDMAGTLPYIAPEQLKGRPGFASDQYSLAIIAYEWLCGYPPFTGSDAEIIMQHISSPPPPLRSQNVFIPRPVEDVIRKALAKDPSQRYDTIRAFARALHDSCIQRPYTITPTSSDTEVLRPTNALPFFYYLSQRPVLVPGYGETPIAHGETPAAHPQPVYQAYASQVTSSMHRNRQRMLQKVRTFWIDGVLEPSLHEGNFITPILHNQQDAVTNPWSTTRYQQEKQNFRQLAELSIGDAYDQANGELLILGEAGSGKTTVLLHLTRYLIEQAERDESLPIPVVFLLSSWTEKQLPLEQWFMEELNNKYQVPRLLAGQWLRSERILPLLDGLDEVAESIRSTCIVTINTYKQEHALSPLVVASRLTEYLLFSPRVILQRAVIVQPLTQQQVDEYFTNVGGNLAVMAQLLHTDPLLYELIITPLMVNIITLAYQDKSPDDLLAIHSSEERYRKILDTYVEQMLRRHPAVHVDDRPQQLIHKLTYLAQKMQQNRVAVFYIEQMQPKWINKGGWLRLYMLIAVLLPGAFIGALAGLLANVLLFHAGSIGSIAMDAVYGMVMGYIFSNRPAPSSSTKNQHSSENTPDIPLFKGASLQTALFVGLITFLCVGSAKGWMAGLTNGLMLGILSIPIYIFIHSKSRIQHTYDRSSNLMSKYLPLEHLKNSVLIGVACGLTGIVTLFVNHTELNKGVIFLISLGIRDSLRNTLLGTLLSLLLLNNNGIIICAEVVSWSWRRFWRSIGSNNIFYNLLLGIVVGVIFGSKELFQDNISNILSAGLSAGLLVMIGVPLVSAILQGILSNKLNNNYRTVPNQGIKRSLYYGRVSLVIGAVIAAFFTIVITLLSIVFTSGLIALMHKHGLQVSLLKLVSMNILLLVPAGGLLAALLLGWLASWQHAILRLILHMTSIIPLKLSRFLNYATDCVLLRRVGGGYIFIHRTLLEYFASLDESPANDTEEQTPPYSDPLVRLL